MGSICHHHWKGMRIDNLRGLRQNKGTERRAEGPRALDQRKMLSPESRSPSSSLHALLPNSEMCFLPSQPIAQNLPQNPRDGTPGSGPTETAFYLGDLGISLSAWPWGFTHLQPGGWGWGECLTEPEQEFGVVVYRRLYDMWSTVKCWWFFFFLSSWFASDIFESIQHIN